MQLVKYQDIPAQGHPIGLARLVPLGAQGDRGLNFGRTKKSGIPLGRLPGYWTCPYNARITGLYLNTDQGGYTVKFWKSVIGTPTVADSINQNGIDIAAPLTHTEIFNLSDFIELDVVIGDTFAVEIVEVDRLHVPTDISGSLLFTQVTEEP
jgi:hypothetical protein